MNHLYASAIGEAELAELNARADAALPYDDDAWDDVVRAAADDCATICESLLTCASGDLE
ncbi:MAG: hypothetical protein ABI724_04170 [Betaproteobacteria bacterium]